MAESIAWLRAAFRSAEALLVEAHCGSLDPELGMC